MSYGFYRNEEAELPHKPLPLAMFLIVEEAICVSWQRLRNRPTPRIDLQTADEDDVTLDLHEVMLDEVFNKGLVDGFDKERFTIVTREAKVRNFDGTMPDKMPDLLVGISGRDEVHRKTQDGLFIECKPVDAAHTVGVHYGTKGISRFIRGEYAWAMTSALMVGYASLGYTIAPKLIESLAGRANEFEVLEMPKLCATSTQMPASDPLYITQHGRTFNYVENGKAAPPIRLRHLWLRRE